MIVLNISEQLLALYNITNFDDYISFSDDEQQEKQQNIHTQESVSKA